MFNLYQRISLAAIILKGDGERISSDSPAGIILPEIVGVRFRAPIGIIQPNCDELKKPGPRK